MSDGECRNELALRERRGELSQSEKVALQAHLVQCAACRLTRRLGRDFEAESVLEPDDGARIARLSALAERWALGQPMSTVPLKRRRARIALFALAAAFAAFGASAATGTLSRVFGDEEEPAAPPTTPAAVQPAAVAQQAAAPRSAAPAKTAEPAEPAATQAASTPARRAPETAASLFKQANDARRGGDATRAIALYRRLGAEFPSSPEAGLAALPLGGLLLDRGNARAALAEFERHAKSGGGRLLPEALYGRGRALAGLGNAAEERRTWTTLLERFPDSPYAGHARRRLAELK